MVCRGGVGGGGGYIPSLEWLQCSWPKAGETENHKLCELHNMQYKCLRTHIWLLVVFVMTVNVGAFDP